MLLRVSFSRSDESNVDRVPYCIQVIRHNSQEIVYHSVANRLFNPATEGRGAVDKRGSRKAGQFGLLTGRGRILMSPLSLV